MCDIHFSHEGQVARVRLNRPASFNALKIALSTRYEPIEAYATTEDRTMGRRA